MGDLSHTDAAIENDGLLLLVEQVGVAHDRHRSEHSDITSSQNSAGDDGENRDLNLPKE
ncbi:hypothetical protein [Nocardiopsis sp. NPDC055824]